jgi:hypothetical protein
MVRSHSSDSAISRCEAMETVAVPSKKVFVSKMSSGDEKGWNEVLAGRPLGLYGRRHRWQSSSTMGESIMQQN